MKRKSEVPWISVIVLVIIAFLLAISLLPYTDSGPNLVTVIGLLVTVIICVSLGSWIALAGETKHKILLLVSLLLGSGLILLLWLFFAVDLAILSPGWMEFHPLAVYSLSVTANCLFVLAAILAFEAFAVYIYIIRTGTK